jgi:hypothetical protein
MLWSSVWEVTILNLQQDTGYPEVYRGLPQSLQENVKYNILNYTRTTAFHILSDSLFTTIQYCIVQFAESVIK